MSQPFFPMNGIRLCIDEVKDGDFSGRAATPLEEDVIPFAGLVDFLLKLDRVFDRHAFPAAFQQRRHFFAGDSLPQSTPPTLESRKSAEELMKFSGTMKTLHIFVRARRGTTWQGELTDEDGTRLSSFDSDLELMNQLKAALS